MAEEARLLIEKLPDLRVVDLKKELEKRKLSKSGSKKELCERLRAQLKIEELKERSSTTASTEQAFDSIPSFSLPAADAGAEPNEIVKRYLEQREKLLERQMEQKKKYQEETYRSQESESQSEAEDLSQHPSREEVLQCSEEKSESFKEGGVPSSSKETTDELPGDDKSDEKYDSETDEDTEKEESNDVGAVDVNAGVDGGMSAAVHDDNNDDDGGACVKNVDVVVSKDDVSDDNVAHSDNKDVDEIEDTPEVDNVVKPVVMVDNKNEDSNDTDVSDSVATDASLRKSFDGKENQSEEKEVKMEVKTCHQDETKEEKATIVTTSESENISADVVVNKEGLAVHNESSDQRDKDNSIVETSQIAISEIEVAVEREKSVDAAMNLEKSLITEKILPLAEDEPLVVMLSKDDEFDEIKPPSSANGSNPENVDISMMDESQPALSDIKEIKKPDPEVKVSARRLFAKHSQKETSSGSTLAEKPTKKRKWGSVDVGPSLVISSDSLKDLIPEVMLDLSVPNDAMDIIGGDDQSVNKSKQHDETKKKQPVSSIAPSGVSTSVTTAAPVRLARTIYQEVEVAENLTSVSQTDDLSQVLSSDRNVEISKERKVIEKKRLVVSGSEVPEKVRVVKEVDRKSVITAEETTSSETATKKRKLNPAIQVDVDEPQAAEGPQREMTPPRNPVSKFIHVFNLVRPYTLPQLKEILSRSGTTVESGFWIDKIKSHCIVEYESSEQAESARMALHGKKWPASNPKILRVDFSSEEELKMMRDSKDGASASAVSRKMQHSKIIPDDITLSRDKLTLEQQAEKFATKLVGEPLNKRDGKRRNSEREKEADISKNEEHRRQECTRPMREWDRNKRASDERENRRSLSRKRRNSGRVSPRRMPDESDRKKSRENEPAHKKPDKVEEPPAKLLDDLFRKTKATPCIYWLPLTEEQIAEKESQVKKIETERMQRRAEREKRLEDEREERIRARAAGQRPMRGPDEKEGHRRREF